jgi:hypothetical protein
MEFMDSLILKDEGSTFVQNVGNHQPKDPILNTSAVGHQMSHSEKLCSLYTLTDYVGLIKSLRMQWVMHVA